MNMDFADLLKNGIPASRIEEIINEYKAMSKEQQDKTAKVVGAVAVCAIAVGVTYFATRKLYDHFVGHAVRAVIRPEFLR